MGDAGSMPAGGMTVAVSRGGSKVMKGSAGDNIQQIHKALKSAQGRSFNTNRIC